MKNIRIELKSQRLLFMTQQLVPVYDTAFKELSDELALLFMVLSFKFIEV
jgi:hypothetical protein